MSVRGALGGREAAQGDGPQARAEPAAADPSNHDELLFDDVLWVERAQYEHDQFVAKMRERGVEVFYFRELLGEALAASEEGRRRLIELAVSEYTVGASLVDEVRAVLWALKPEELARHLIGGMTVAEAGLDLGKLGGSSLGAAALGRPQRLHPSAAAQHAVHPGLVVLDLRGGVGQSHVLAGATTRGLQRRRHLPLPPDVRRRRVRVLVSGTG